MTNRKNNLAAIDIGTNSFHLIVAETDQHGEFDIIDREKEVIRLGNSSGSDIKYISGEAKERAIETLGRFAGIARSHNAEIRAVATSAVRESINRYEFIREVKERTGVSIEIIDGLEEARLIYLGILKASPVYNKWTLCIDIGGGSTEFIIGKEGSIVYSASQKLGAVRLTQKFFPDGKVTDKGVSACRDWVKGEIFRVVRETAKNRVEVCVGSSGTIAAAAEMIDTNIAGGIVGDSFNNYSFSYDNLVKLEEDILSRKTPEERSKIKGLDSKRVDIIPAGIIILSTIMRETGLKEITYSDYALREGVIIDSIKKLVPGLGDSELNNIRFNSVQKLSESSAYPKSHCRHVSELSAQLFNSLRELHKLDDSDREYLEAAAVLHDIGYHISHSKHHKHSNYIIRNSELLGFTENEKSIIGNIARYHRKSHPKKSHKEYWDLDDKSKEKVRKLSAILRIADALDRSHSGRVEAIDTEIVNGSVKLHLKSDGKPADVEMWNFERRKGLFEEVYHKKISTGLE